MKKYSTLIQSLTLLTQFIDILQTEFLFILFYFLTISRTKPFTHLVLGPISQSEIQLDHVLPLTTKQIQNTGTQIGTYRFEALNSSLD